MSQALDLELKNPRTFILNIQLLGKLETHIESWNNTTPIQRLQFTRDSDL
jgi:hypothetical protein